MNRKFLQAMLVLFTLMALTFSSLGTVTVSAASGVDLFNNLSSNLDTYFGVGENDVEIVGQKFSTDETHTQVTAIGMKVCRQAESTGTFSVELWDAAGAGGLPGQKITDVAINQDFSTLPLWTGVCNPDTYFDSPAYPISLSANTSYYVVVRANPGASGSLAVTATRNQPGGSAYDYFGDGTWSFEPSTDLLMHVIADSSATSHTVTFDKNAPDATGPMDPQTSSSAANLYINKFKRAGYNFYGWNIEEDGSGTAYADQASYPFDADATLFAQWCPNTITVMNNADSGAGSLRQAIADVCPEGMINFDAALSDAVINLSSTLTIDKILTIDGSSLQAPIIVSGDSGPQPDGFGDVTLFYIPGGEAPIDVTFDSLVFSAGFANGQPYLGGAIHDESSGVVTVTNSSFYGNDGFNGGAIYMKDNATSGGEFNTFDGALAVSDSYFIANSALDVGGQGHYGNGGAIYGGGDVTIFSSTFADNTATNFGGAVVGKGISTLIVNSTFAGNNASIGGAIGAFNSSGTQIFNSTIAGNEATTTAKGLYVYGGSFSVTNTILDNQWGDNCGVNQGQSVTDGGHNIDSGETCGFSALNASLNNTDPLLDPEGLEWNNGPTPTIKLLAGSPALGAGDQDVCDGREVNGVDQRGEVRPQPAESACDIGAFESALTISQTPDFGKSAPLNAATSVSLTPTLSWEASFGADSYEYCYGSVPGPCSNWISVGTNTSVVMNTLVPNYTYYWQARAISQSAGTTEADGGTVWSFTTVNTPVHNWPAYTPPSSPSFSDVTQGATFEDWVERLFNAGITAGCGSGNFCPGDTVNRAQMAIFILRAKHGGSSYTPPAVGESSGFNDVPTSATYSAWVKQLAAEGVTAGCGNSNFCPSNSVNRAQMAIFLLRARHGGSYVPPAVGSDSGFNDVPTSASYAPWVKQLAAEGITTGCGNNNYCPGDTVNRAQMAIFLVRAFGLP